MDVAKPGERGHVLRDLRVVGVRHAGQCRDGVAANSSFTATPLDFVRFAVSRYIEAKLVFAHGTTDPVADAAFLVCEALHLHPDQFEAFAAARVTAAEGRKILDFFAPDQRDQVRDIVLPAVSRNGRWEGELAFRNFRTDERIPVWYSIFEVREVIHQEQHKREPSHK